MSLAQRIREEPALFLGLVEALIALAIGFGLDLTSEQFALIMAALAALLAIIVRQQVTPTVNLNPPTRTQPAATNDSAPAD